MVRHKDYLTGSYIVRTREKFGRVVSESAAMLTTSRLPVEVGGSLKIRA